MSWYNLNQPPKPFHDHRWVRADMVGWDAKWAALRPESRHAFLGLIVRRPDAQVPTLTDSEVRPLTAGGFLTPQRDRMLTTTDQVRGFAQRLATLAMAGLLSPEGALRDYCYQAYYQYELEMALSKVLENATGLTFYAVSGSPLDMIIAGPRWPDWVADFLKDPLAKPLLEAMEMAGGSVTLEFAPRLLPSRPPVEVRKTLDKLVNYLALVEDLDEKTAELRVGFLPSALSARKGKAARAAKELQPVTPKEVGPADGTVIPDVAAVLLELAGGPVRVKQNGELYVRDLDRLTAILPPLPNWFPALDPADRVYNGLSHCRDLELVRMKRTKEGDTLEQTPAGRDWLALPHEAKFAAVYRDLGEVITADRYQGPSDELFLGYDVAVVPRKGKEKTPNSPHQLTKNYDPRLLREALRRSLSRLEVGKFYRLPDLIEHILATENPLLLGRESAADVHIARQGRMVLPLDELVEGVGRELLRNFIGSQFAPLGAFQIGDDSEDPDLLVARQPRMDLYFDPTAVVATPTAQPTRVLVQPDFTVIILGLDAAPAADLSAFAERDRSSVTPGSFTFRLTREAVLRAAAGGLGGEEILARLKKHASNPVPANVETQLRTWAGQIHRATAEPFLVIRCQSSEAAEKAMAALGNKAVRLGPLNVGWSAQKLTAALRQKLASQGVIV